jgi:predicted DNA-binding transcriptional regulator YafY
MATRLGSRTERLNTIEQMLYRSPTGLRVVEIATACDVDRRTIYRDLSALMKTGVPVYQKDGRFFIHRDYYLANLGLNLTEAAMVMVAIRSLLYQQDQHNPHLVAVLRKLSAIMPELPAMHLSTLVQTFWSSPVDRAYVQVLETLIRGWGEHRIVKLWFGEVAHEFAIYFIEPSPFGVVCVFGYDYVRQQVCALKIRRIKRAKLLRTSFALPSEAELENYLSYAWEMAEEGEGQPEEIVLLFPAEVVSMVRQRLWTGARFEPIAENRYALRVRTSDWHSLLPWIRSWGAQVEVIAPQPLRERLAAEAATLATVYAR